MKNCIILATALSMNFFISGSDHKVQGNNSTIAININAQSTAPKQNIDLGTYKQLENGFDYEGYLEEHQWEKRSQNLTSEEQDLWLKFFTTNAIKSNKQITRGTLAPLMIQGLDYIEYIKQFKMSAHTNKEQRALKRMLTQFEIIPTKPSCSSLLKESALPTICSLDPVCPQARITNWHPGSYGNAEPYHIIKSMPKLPIWVRIGFDGDVTQTFVNEFFSTLRSTDNLFNNINPKTHGKFRKEFVITIGPNYTPQEIQILIEKANNTMHDKLNK